MRAWKEAAKELNATLSNTREIELFLSTEAWNEYVPVTLEEFGWEPDVPAKEQITGLYDKDIKNLVGSEMDQKIAAIQNEISVNPKSAKLYNKLGVTYARYGKYKESLKNLQKSVSLNNRYFSAYNNIGNVYYLTGQYEQALTCNKKARSITSTTLSSSLMSPRHCTNSATMRMQKCFTWAP